MKRLVAMAVVVAVLALAAGTALAWHAPVEGMPTVLAQGDVRGYFIWQDGNGVHLRVHTKMFMIPFNGTIRTDGYFTKVHGQKLEFGDHYWLDGTKRTLHFKFTTAGAMDGLDFMVAGGSNLVFDLFMDGAPADPQEIYVGHEGWRPGTHRFTLRR